MSTELIKLFGPVLILCLWFRFALHVKPLISKAAGLFFVSFVGFSSNFSFIYRELHQSIQMVMIAIFLIQVIRYNRIYQFNLILGAFLGFIVISLVFMPFDEDAKTQLINYIVMIGMVNFLCTSIQSKKDLDCLMCFVADIAFLLALMGLLEYPFNEDGRIEATFSNPNYYGLFLGIGICLGSFYWSGKLRIIGIGLLLVSIVLCGSRSALAFPMFLYLWIIYRQGKIIKVIPLALVGMIIIVTISNLGITRFSDTEATGDSDSERVAFAQIAMRMAHDNPLTGVGWGRFISEFRNYSSAAEAIQVAHGAIDVSKQERRVAHNDFLRILAELGWIAFILSIVFIIYGLKLIIFEKGFGFDFIPPVWCGVVFFSVGHNNMNNVLCWFFLILPFFIKDKIRKL